MRNVKWRSNQSSSDYYHDDDNDTDQDEIDYDDDNHDERNDDSDDDNHDDRNDSIYDDSDDDDVDSRLQIRVFHKNTFLKEKVVHTLTTPYRAYINHIQKISFLGQV